MSNSPHPGLSPTITPEPANMPRALLGDLDACMVSAAEAADYIYTAARPELDRIRRRVAAALDQAPAPPGDVRAHTDRERLVAVGGLLETEAACRDLVAQDAIDETAELAHELAQQLNAYERAFDVASTEHTAQRGARVPRNLAAATLAASASTLAIPLPPDADGSARTPARDAFLNARAEARAVGIALADPRMRRALILDRLQYDHARIAASLPRGYDAERKPPVWRARERSDWQHHRETARALNANANAEWQKQIRTELRPRSEQIARQARALADAREYLLARAPELQRNAIAEELARDPEWLTDTLGPRPEQDAGRWQTLAGQLAANRMRFLVADDADPGIRPEQSHLAQQVAQLQVAPRLAPSVALTPALGLGMSVGQ